MTRDADYLYLLLPTVYRQRDEAQGWPLRDLLRVVSEQVNVVEEDIARLYDNWFVETCDDWVVPYLGDLVGYRPLSEASALGDPDRAGEAARGRALIPRRDVAGTIGFRRRKGTLALLEELADAVAAWPARAVEFLTLIGWTQHLDHQRLGRGQTVDLRSTERLDNLSGPFDDIAHGADVRRPVSHRSRGLHNVPSVGVFVWRLASYGVTRAPAACIEREGSHCYTFSVLGHDTPLFNRPEAGVDPTHITEAGNVPVPISRRAFEHRLSEHPLTSDASPAYYGPIKSLSIEVLGWPKRGAKGLIASEDVIPADLSKWQGYSSPRGKVLVDPMLGRLMFAPAQSPKGVLVSYHYGFSSSMGAGEYAREVSQPGEAQVYRVRQQEPRDGEFRTVKDALEQWQRDKAAPGAEGEELFRAAVLEVADSGVYEERFAFTLDPGEYLQLRSAPLTRPVLRLLDYRVDQPDPFSVTGGRASRFVLDGFLVTGRGIEVTGNGPGDRPGDSGSGGSSADDQDDDGELCDVAIRHCTLVPGWDLACDCTPERRDEPSLTLTYSRTRVVVEHSIIGSVWVEADQRGGDPAELVIRDSIVDATSTDGLAISSGDGRLAFVDLTLARCTVIGEVRVHTLQLGVDSIFTSHVSVARRQVGCVRYCYVPVGSRTPRRHRCQPDVVVEEVASELRRRAADAGTSVDPEVLGRAQLREADRVRPVFESIRYGNPTYAQLADVAAAEIRRGAHDESEFGAFHDLYQPQRAANLRNRFDEYTPAGLDTGIFHAT